LWNESFFSAPQLKRAPLDRSRGPSLDRITIASSRGHWVFYLCIASLFVGIGVLLLVVHRSPVAAWANIIFFGVAGIFFATQVFARQPRIVIDDLGILDRTLKVGVIEWRDIRDARLTWRRGRPLICLDLVDSTKYTSRLSPMLQRLVALNRKLGLTDLSLNLAGTKAEPERIEQRIKDEIGTRHREPAV